MSKPILSVLIPSVPSRYARAGRLFNKLLNSLTPPQQAEVEILVLTDNKMRTIGAKREALKTICHGDYFMFCDDDDDILNLGAVLEACFTHSVDVITFKQKCRNKDGSTYIVTFHLGNEVEHKTDGNGNYLDINRPPWHVCAWHESFKQFSFADVNYSEDWPFVKAANTAAKTEFFIDEVIGCYNFDPNTTEASTEDNAEWKNPNTPVIPSPVVPKNSTLTPVIINAITGNYNPQAHQRYSRGQERLVESLREHWLTPHYGHALTWNDEAQVGAPRHTDNPYAFKIYAIEKARHNGYLKILWTDASIIAVKDPRPVFDFMTKAGIFIEEAGHWTGTWCNDYTLNYFRITREQAMKMPMYAAGYVGFDFTNQVSIELFAEWKEAMLNGCFRGDWSNHRHDMTSLSILADKYKLRGKASTGGQFFSYIGPAYGQPLPTSCFHLLGL